MNNFKKIAIFISSLFYFSCNSIFDNSNESSDGKLYVALQGMGNRVALLSADDLELIEMVDINLSNEDNVMEMPHYIAVDEQEKFWFVTTMGSRSVGMFSAETNTLIDYLSLESPPALLEIDANSNLLYVSRMPNTDLLGNGMIMGSSSSVIDIISYSPNGMILSGSYDTSLQSPHAISINLLDNNIISASLTYDFLSKIDLASQTVSNFSLDSSVNPDPVIEMNRLKPIEIIQTDNYAFVNCLGGVWQSEQINGQVQMWSVNPLKKISEFQFSSDSNPWHLVSDPISESIYVVLSGYLNGSGGKSGIVKLQYNDTNLQLVWENIDSDMNLFHGVDISENGDFIYVSSRDGRIFKFDSHDGNLLHVKDLSTNLFPYPAPGGIKYTN